LSPIPLGISKFDETYRFGKRRSNSTICSIFRLRGAEILYLHQVEVRQQNSLEIKVFKGAFFFNFAYLLTIKYIWGNSKVEKGGIKGVSYKLIENPMRTFS